MNHRYALSVASALLLALGACASIPPVTVDEALAMTKSGSSPDRIIDAMKASRAHYNLSASDIVRLHEAGLPTAVLDYMQQTQLEAVAESERQREWMFGPRCFSFRRCW